MNIFYTDPDPYIAARNLCDKHVPKMILESTQMLCTACHKAGVAESWMYRPAYQHHPCTIWAGYRKDNFNWLLEHAFAISFQYYKRYDKKHACLSVLQKLKRLNPAKTLVSGLSKPALAMPDHYKNESLPVLSYRRYYWGDKRRFAEWAKGTPAPNWWSDFN